MRPKGNSEELERRRVRAVQLVEQGESPGVVAQILGVTPQTLHRWRRLAHQGDGLRSHPVTGRPRLLSDKQLKHLEAMLLKGPTAHGWSNQLWTAATGSRVDSTAFWCRLPPRTCAQIAEAATALDQPEAAETRPGTERQGSILYAAIIGSSTNVWKLSVNSVCIFALCSVGN